MVRPSGVQSFYDFRQQTAEGLSKAADELIKDCQVVYDGVGAVEADKVSFATVLKPLLDIDAESYTRGVAIQLAGMVAEDKALRDASSEAEKRLDDFGVEMAMRK